MHLRPVAPGLPRDGWKLRVPGLLLQWLSLLSPTREESAAVPQVPCIPPETVVTRAEEPEQLGPVETEAEQVSLLPAPSVSPQEVSMGHGLTWPPGHSLPGGPSFPVSTELKCEVGRGNKAGGTGLPRQGWESAEGGAGSAPPNRTLCPRGLFPALHSPPRSSMRTL